jgi:hypothetical protein
MVYLDVISSVDEQIPPTSVLFGVGAPGPSLRPVPPTHHPIEERP